MISAYHLPVEQINEPTHASLHRDLTLYYQPQVEIESGRIVGVEALLRSKCSQYGQAGPVGFIRHMEKIGQISRLGDWVLRGACRQLCVLQDAGFTDLRMAVNISPLQLNDIEWVGTVARALHDHRLDAQLLELEVTESIPIADLSEAVDIASQLKALGVKLAIDDFGTGHSNLNYLKHFSFDRVKLDRLFICDYPKNDADIELLQALIDLIHSLRIEVVAEGVENEAQMSLLHALGCDLMQGYVVAPPMPAAAFTNWLLFQTRESRAVSV